jgi:hypothetical protein
VRILALGLLLIALLGVFSSALAAVFQWLITVLALLVWLRNDTAIRQQSTISAIQLDEALNAQLTYSDHKIQTLTSQASGGQAIDNDVVTIQGKVLQARCCWQIYFLKIRCEPQAKTAWYYLDAIQLTADKQRMLRLWFRRYLNA